MYVLIGRALNVLKSTIHVGVSDVKPATLPIVGSDPCIVFARGMLQARHICDDRSAYLLHQWTCLHPGVTVACVEQLVGVYAALGFESVSAYEEDAAAGARYGITLGMLGYWVFWRLYGGAGVWVLLGTGIE